MGEAGGLPDDVLEVAEMQTIISLVAGGFGVSLVPASVGQVDRSGVAFRADRGPDADDRARARLAARRRTRRCATSSWRSPGRGAQSARGATQAPADAIGRLA